MVKNLPAMQETWVRSLGWEDPLEKGMATHSSILAWRILWTEEPGGLQSMGSQRVTHRPAGSESSCLQDAQEVHMWAAPFKFLPWLHAESSGHYENTWCLAPPRDADGVIWVWPGYLSPFSSCPDDSYVWFGQWPCVRSSLSHTLGSLGWFEGGTCLGSMQHLSSQDLGR